MTKIPRHTRTAIFLLLTFSFGLVTVEAQSITTLRIGEVRASPGQIVEIPIYLNNRGTVPVAALQFDVTADPREVEFLELKVGPSSARAGKQLSSRQSNYGDDPAKEVRRVVVAGLNRNGILDGPVAIAVVRVKPGLKGSTSILTLANVLASQPDARPLPISVGKGKLLDATQGAAPNRPPE